MSVSPCFSCGKKLEPVWDDLPDSWQASGAARFVSYGQYGSEFDPMDGSFLAINICDECIEITARNTNRIIYIPKDGNASEYKGIIG